MLLQNQNLEMLKFKDGLNMKLFIYNVYVKISKGNMATVIGIFE